MDRKLWKKYLNVNLDIKRENALQTAFYLTLNSIKSIKFTSKVVFNYSIFKDYEKCYDKINRLILWQKLLAEGMSYKVTRAIKAMYLVIKSAIRYNRQISNIINSQLGVKHADPSSAVLFMMFVNDILATRGAGVSWSLIGYRCAAETLLTHPIHVYSICEKAYLFIYTSHNLYHVHVFGTFK